MSRRLRLLLAVLAAVLLCSVGVWPKASASTPVVDNPPGEPQYSVPVDTLAAALSCSDPTLSHTAHEPVLLVHGTMTNPQENWGWNYAHVLPPLGYDVCMVALPDRALGDIQVSAEYVVYAIRWMFGTGGRKVDVMGHSQGPLEPRWALKWWPSLRDEVDDFVMLAAPNHGVVEANAAAYCTASCLQMKQGSAFLNALNAGGETPVGPSYTSIYSLTDELVQPAAPQPTAALDGATNILMQDVCPGRVVEHVQFASDAAVYALVMDAFTHPGTADPARIAKNSCNQTWMPGIDSVGAMSTLANDWYKGWGSPSYSTTEPALKCYAGGPCP